MWKRFLSTGFASWTLIHAGGVSAATEFSPADLVTATGIAVNIFARSNPDHVVHFTGFKSWKTGLDAAVRVYVNHDGMAMNFDYTCSKSDSQIRCNAK